MKSYDLHGMPLEEAISYVESLIGKIRLKGVEEEIIVITGRGIIRKELIKYLDLHKIQHRFQLGNDGVIIIEVD